MSIDQQGAGHAPLAFPAVCGLVLASLLSACGGGADDGETPEAAAAAASVVPEAAQVRPYIVVQPRSRAVEAGGSASFQVQVDPTTTRGRLPAYQWLRNGVPIAGATGSTYTVAAAADEDDGADYAAVVSTAVGETRTRSARLGVTTRPPPGGVQRWVDAAAGNDANPGDESRPYKTISKAMAVVTSGGTIWLKEGTWTPKIDPALGANKPGLNCPPSSSPQLPGSAVVRGTALLAVNPKKTVINYLSDNAICVGDTAVVGVRFVTDTTRTDLFSISAAGPGNSTVSGAHFEGGHVVVRNGGKLTLETAAGSDYGHPWVATGRTASVWGAGSQLTIRGGRLDLSGIDYSLDPPTAGCPDNASLMVHTGGRLVLDDLEVVAAQSLDGQQIIGACANASVEINGSRLVGPGPWLGAYAVRVVSSTLTLSASSISNYSLAIHTDNSVVELDDGSAIESSQTGILAAATAPDTWTTAGSITLRPGSKIRNASGAPLTVVGTTAVDIRTSTLTAGSESLGVRFVTTTNCIMRDNYVSSGRVAIGMSYGAACDLGTAASPGGNILVAGEVRVTVWEAHETVKAVGNYWFPNEQLADGNGRYSVPAGMGSLVISGPVSTGKNFRLGAGDRIRLAD